MSITDIAAVAWLILAGYGLSVLQSWKRTSVYLREEVARMAEQERTEGQ